MQQWGILGIGVLVIGLFTIGFGFQESFGHHKLLTHEITHISHIVLLPVDEDGNKVTGVECSVVDSNGNRVVGMKGETEWQEKNGRVKVKFPWVSSDDKRDVVIITCTGPDNLSSVPTEYPAVGPAKFSNIVLKRG